MKLRFLFFLLLFCSVVFAVDDVNFKLSSVGLNAQNALVESKLNVSKLVFAKLPHSRVDDLLGLAQSSFEQQVLKEKNGLVANYGIVFSKVFEANKVVDLAFKNKDELFLLKNDIDDSVSKHSDADFLKVLEIYSQAGKEFKSQRYELSLKLVDESRVELAKALSFGSKASALASQTSKSVVSFFVDNWQYILAFFILLFFLFFLFQKHFQIFVLSRKIVLLQLESSVVQSLIGKAQKEYFELGSMPETIYTARINLFSRKLRDLTRELAVLNEDLAMLKAFGKVKKGKKS